MLFPRPPQPVDRRREVATVVASHKQAASIAPGHVFIVPAARRTDPPARHDSLSVPAHHPCLKGARRRP